MTLPTQEEIESWIEISRGLIDDKLQQIKEGPIKQSRYTTIALSYASLGRAKALRGDPPEQWREGYREAARAVLMSFRMAYDDTLAEYLGDNTDYSEVSEVDAVDGITYALASSDFELARELANWTRDRGDGKKMQMETRNYVFGLKHFLLSHSEKANPLLDATLEKYGANPPKGGYKRNYHSLTVALSGIVNKNQALFEAGLHQQAAFYKGLAQGENADTSHEHVDDHLVALGNLGIYHGLKVPAGIPYLPANMLISVNPPLSR